MPNTNLMPAEKYQLETMIDRAGLSSVLIGMAEIASEKAAHIAENWQDKGLSKAWDDAERVVRITAGHRAIMRLT